MSTAVGDQEAPIGERVELHKAEADEEEKLDEHNHIHESGRRRGVRSEQLVL